jgi:hypothetical protein
VSLIPTFGFMMLFGFSLNVVTLLSLTLVIGILVDDAIVEIENIEKRVSARPAALSGRHGRRRRYRPGRGRHHLLDRRRLHAGVVPERHRRPVLQGVRHHRFGRRADVAADGASADARCWPPTS